MDKKIVVEYRKNPYDLTEFIKKHPGGLNTLQNISNSNIDYKFDKMIPHSNAAKYLINEYKLNKINNIELSSKGNKLDIIVEDNDSVEHLVDWSQAMVKQIPKLGIMYEKWVSQPVDRSLRLFDYEFLEMLTKTPWWMVPLIWLPTICAISYFGILDAFNKNYGITYSICRFTLGIGIWTLLEYSLHRWVFHMKLDSMNTFINTFHFLLHGLHHKVPFDSYRLVFPPLPAAITAFIFYMPICVFFECSKLLLAGTLFGYLVYDMIHYYIHYGSPAKGYFYQMKRYHYQHHFASHDKGYGISSTIWDDLLGSKIILRKLGYSLKW